MSESAHLGVFIYARADSRRLPGKALLPFGQGTLLDHVINRARQVHAKTWALLTSDRTVDDPIASTASEAGFEVIRGSATDLVARTLNAVHALDVDRFVRINADSPLFEPHLLNSALDRGSSEHLVSNLIDRRFPYGVAVEIVGTNLYLRLADTVRPHEREHVTQHLYRQVSAGSLRSLSQQADHSHLRLAVDTAEDYEHVQALFDPPASPLAPYWDLLALEEPVLRWHCRDG